MVTLNAFEFALLLYVIAQLIVLLVWLLFKD